MKSRISRLLRRVSVIIANKIGTIEFIMGQATFLAAWFLWNTLAPSPWQFDKYPFILANLFMSAEAAFATSLLLMAAEIVEEKDRKLTVDDLTVDQETNEIVKAIADKLGVTSGTIQQGNVDASSELHD